MSRGQGRVVSGGQVSCGDGMALSYDPCQRTNMTRCGALQHLSLSGLYSGGSPLALRAETMGAVVGEQSEVQTGDVRPRLYSIRIVHSKVSVSVVGGRYVGR